jgi:opacity protein-like surface antigen
MKWKWAVLVLAAAASSSALAAAWLTPQVIAADIAAHGADAVVSRLFRSGDYDRVLDRIDSGDAEWVALAPKLAPGTDAGTAEALIISLAFALPKNPQAVLALLSGKASFAVEDVCGAPFIEGTVKDVPSYVRKTRAAVSRVTEARLASAKSACLAALAKA